VHILCLFTAPSHISLIIPLIYNIMPFILQSKYHMRRYDTVYSRLVVGVPGVDINNNIDTSTWTNATTEMNTTLNKDAEHIADLRKISVANGLGCFCGIQQLDFGEWLRVNSERNSTFGIDLFAIPEQVSMPSNWRDVNATFGQDDPAYIDLVETPSNNTPLVAVNSFGTHKPELALSSTPGGTAVFTSTNDLVTNNKFIKIHSDGEGPVTIRAMSKGRYNLVVYLIQEEPPYSYTDDGFVPCQSPYVMTTGSRSKPPGLFPNVFPFNRVDMYTDRSAGSFSETNAYILPPTTDGCYYQIMIKNDEDGSINDFDSTDLKCTIGKYGLELKNEVSLSLESCEVTACNGGIVEVNMINAVHLDPSEASKSKNVGNMLLLVGYALSNLMGWNNF